MLLRKADLTELPVIWEILQQAIEQRRLEGSDQWQNGYPNKEIVYDDIMNGNGYVMSEKNLIIAYAAIIFGIEPAYNDIKGKWLTDDEYVVVHRVATLNSYRGKGVATRLFQMVEKLSIECKVYSIKIDTNFDNVPMLKILDRLNYTFCGEILFGGDTRKAFEKVLDTSVFQPQ